MTARLRLSADAEADVREAKDRYAEQGVPGLEERFQLELHWIFEQVEDAPLRFPVVYRDVRRANLRRFPYAVTFHKRGEVRYVLAVVHQARHPRVWQGRR